MNFFVFVIVTCVFNITKLVTVSYLLCVWYITHIYTHVNYVQVLETSMCGNPNRPQVFSLIKPKDFLLSLHTWYTGGQLRPCRLISCNDIYSISDNSSEHSKVQSKRCLTQDYNLDPLFLTNGLGKPKILTLIL